MKRVTCLVLCLLMIVGMFTGCGSKTETPTGPGTQTEAAPAKDTITFAYETEPSNLGPTENDQIAAYYIAYLMFNGLFKNTADGVVNDLCTEYTTENDENGQPTIWVLKLREGVKFSDGSDLTAQDVVDTFEYARTAASAKAKISFTTKTEVVDDYTVKLYTNGVYGAVPQALCAKQLLIMPSELIAKGADEIAMNPIGSGPYKLVKWNKGENILLVANENYYGDAPAIPNINWKFMAEGTSRTIALEAGEVDFVISVDALDIPRLQSNDKYNVSITNGSMYTYMRLNCSKAPFNDANFRKFLAAAINRDDIVKVALDGYGTPITSCVNIAIAGNTDVNSIGTDKAKAEEYLKAWGGDPSTVSFEIVVATDVRRRMAEVIQSNLLEYGINTEVKMTESATTSTIVANGEYDCVLFAYTTDDFMAFAKQLYYTGPGCTDAVKWMMGDATWQNPMIDEIAQELDSAKQLELISKFNEQLNLEEPNVPIYCSQVILGYDKNLNGVKVNPMGFFRVEEFSWN